MALIQITDLTFTYPGSFDPVFEHVSFQLDTDWRLGLTGRNGRGKTPLLRLLQGQYPHQGTITAPGGFEYFPYPIPDAALTPRELLEYCAEIQRSGRSEPVMYNDEVIIKGLVDNGIPIEDARQYTNDGCWEILIGGKCNFLYEQVHCLRLLEYVLQRGMNMA